MNELNNYVAEVKGDHYQSPLQHWDLMELYDVDYLLATATKYLTRWRRKGDPINDLAKCLSFFQKVLLSRPGGARRLVPMAELERYFGLNGYEDLPRERVIFERTLGSGSRADIEWACCEVLAMLQDLKAGRLAAS